MKMVVFDMDGTLIAESSWELLHQYFRSDSEKVRLNREAYFSQRTDYETWMEKDIALWDSPTLQDLREALSHYTLQPSAKTVVSCLRSKKIIPCIVSSGVNILAKMVARELEILPELVFANQLVISDGIMKGVLRVEPYKKHHIVRQICQKLAVPSREVAAVGDAAPDISLFKAAGLKLAYNPKDHLIVQAADHVLQDLGELLAFC